MYSVNPAVKFSYEMAKGSQKQRDLGLRILTDEVFNRSMASANEEYIYLKDYKKAIKDTLPEKKRLMVTGIRGVYEGARKFLYNKADEIVGQMLQVPKYSEIIRVEDVPTCIHEVVHFLDTLLNPKTTARATKMYKKKMYDDKKFKPLLENSLYHKEVFDTVQEKQEIIEHRKKQVEKFLEGKSIEDKIDIIQDLRFDMQTEYKAFSNERRIVNRMYDLGYEVYPQDLKNRAGEYMFKEKAEMLKNIGLDIISKERKNHAECIRQAKNNQP